MILKNDIEQFSQQNDKWKLWKVQFTELYILWWHFENTLELDLSIIASVLWDYGCFFLFFGIHLLSKFSTVLNEGQRKNIVFFKSLTNSSL